MSAFYDQASLVVVPSGYKISKVYAQKPLTTDGQLTFSRASAATRVNSAGLIEKVRTNLVLQSETFGNASWGKSLVTITDNFDTAPNGTLTADRFVSAGGAFPQIGQARTVVSGTQYTASLYVKSDGTTQRAQVLIMGGNTVSFTPTNTWQRITTTFTAASSSATFVLATNSGVAPASSFVIWGAQLETGDIATAYIATTSAAVSVGPVANVPRLDYHGSTCPKLLLEPQRTNLVTNSENLNGAGWSLQGSTITSNATTSPDGYSNADAIVETATTNEHNRIAITSLTAASHTASVFLKKFNQTWCAVYLFNGTVGIRHWINLDTLTAGTSANIGAGITAPLTLTNYGNGWVRASMTFTPTAGSWSFYIACARSNGGATTYAGDGTSGLYAWGAQVEAGAYATSYIPTLGAAVTRGADACSKTGISSLIGQSEGVICFEWEYQNVGSIGGNIPISLDGGFGNEIYFWVQTNGTYRFDVYSSGSAQANITGSMGSFGTKKIALAYKNNDFALYINGVLAGTDTSGTVPTCNQLYIGRFYGNTDFNISSRIKQALLFKTRLTNAQLAELTTL